MSEQEPKGHVCPECGETFKLAMNLGAHRRARHGVAGKGRHRAKGRGGGGAPRESSRKVKVKKTLVELADLSDDIRGRGGTDLPEHLADVIRHDADQLATIITAAADNFGPVRSFVDNIFVKFVAPAVGAMGVVRWLFRYVRRRAEQAPPSDAELQAMFETSPPGDGNPDY